MSQKNKLDFSEFFPTNGEVWKNKILQELGDENDLNWNYKNLSFQKAYSSENLPSGFENFHKHFILKAPRHWYNREYIIIDDANHANELALHALNAGADAIEYVYSHQITSPKAISSLLHNIPLNFSPVHFSIKSSLKEFVEKLTEENFTDLKGSVIADLFLLKEKEFSFLPSIKEVVDSIQKLDNIPQLRVISIQASELHKQGVSPEVEIAYAIGAAIDVLDAVTNHNITIEEAFSRMEFSLSIGKSFFIEVAKLRAFRLVWDAVVKSFNSNLDSFATPLHCYTASHSFSEDSNYNILHNTTEAISAVIGGCDSLTVLPFTINQKTIDPFSSRISRNISLLLKEEAYFSAVTDPGGGSYMLENMTFQIAEKSLGLLKEIEQKGGLTKAIHSMKS